MSVAFSNETDETKEVIVDEDFSYMAKVHEIDLTASNAISIGRSIDWDFNDEDGCVCGVIDANEVEDFMQRLEKKLAHSMSFPSRSTYHEYMIPRFIALARNAIAHGEAITYG